MVSNFLLVVPAKGLVEFILPLGSSMWHEFALGLDWSAPDATSDLLETATAIIRAPGCDLATAALILAKAVGAGLHNGTGPACNDAAAAQGFVQWLHGLLRTHVFPARFALPPDDLRFLGRQLGPHGPFPIRYPMFGTRDHRPPYTFRGTRIYRIAPPLVDAG